MICFNTSDVNKEKRKYFFFLYPTFSALAVSKIQEIVKSFRREIRILHIGLVFCASSHFFSKVRYTKL